MITVSDRLSEESAKDYVLRQLTYNIVNVNLIPGEQIDIPQLCTLFSVSRSPVRDHGRGRHLTSDGDNPRLAGNVANRKRKKLQTLLYQYRA